MNKNIFSLLIVCSIFFSCKRQIPASSETFKEEDTITNISTLNIRDIDFIYFSSKAKLNYNDGANDLKANTNIRIKKDSIIWISVNAAAGFEALRCIITQDSVHIIDRLKNEYTPLDMQGLGKLLNTNLTYSMIQAMIMGNLMIQPAKEDKVQNLDTDYSILTQKNGNLAIHNHIKTSSMKIEMVDIKPYEGNDNLTIKYFNFVPLGVYSFPIKNQIVLQHQEGSKYQTINIDIDHNKFECPEKGLNFPFHVPAKFERK